MTGSFEQKTIDSKKVMATPRSVKIWIDLDNTPHVPFFIPIIRELERRDYQVVLTARDAYQVCELADIKQLRYVKIGRHYGKKKIWKLFGLLWRTVQLIPFYLHQRPVLALAHGSRSLFLLGNLLRIPTVVVMDYEHTGHFRPSRPRWRIVPEALAGEISFSKAGRLRYYRGIKEDVYAPEFKPDPSILDELGLRKDNKIVIAVRPPADEAHYHCQESDKLLYELMLRICQTPGIQAILLPRNKRQELTFKENHPEWFVGGRTIIPPRVVDGLNLLWFSDLAVSGGGTMNREAAALGVPVYSIFRGKIGMIDRILEKKGQLKIIRNNEEVWTKIQFIRRDKIWPGISPPREALKDIVDNIEEIIWIEKGRPYEKKKFGGG
jgi:predicted glycosyltransferase